jgi:hypothetical protein
MGNWVEPDVSLTKEGMDEATDLASGEPPNLSEKDRRPECLPEAAG